MIVIEVLVVIKVFMAFEVLKVMQTSESNSCRC